MVVNGVKGYTDIIIKPTQVVCIHSDSHVDRMDRIDDIKVGQETFQYIRFDEDIVIRNNVPFDATIAGKRYKVTIQEASQNAGKCD
jgi:hypothetical protein